MEKSNGLWRQYCLDGKCLLLGVNIITERVKQAIAELRGSVFRGQDDLECILNVVDEELWHSMSDFERNTLYAVFANVYSTLIENEDEFCDSLYADGINITLDKGAFIPCGEDLREFSSTLIKVGA